MSKRGKEVAAEASKSVKRVKKDDLSSTPSEDLIVFRQAVETPYNSYRQQRFTDFNIPQFLKDKFQNFNPSRIQALCLPLILEPARENLIAQGHIGSGKTLTCILALISQVTLSLQKVQCICLVPNHAMITQCANLLRTVTVQEISIGLIGEAGSDKKGYGSQIIIGTPTSVFLSLGKLNLTRVKILAVDEGDLLTQEVFQVHLKGIWNRICDNPFGLGGANCQVLVFASTFCERAHNKILNIFTKKKFKKLLLQEKELLSKRIKHLKVYLEREGSKQEFFIGKLLPVAPDKKAIVFVNTTEAVHRVATALESSGSQILTYTDTSDLNKFKALQDFKVGKNCVLVTTNLLSRGYNIHKEVLVVNYDMPSEASSSSTDNEDRVVETYLHRSGRTGRFGQRGVVVNLIVSSLDHTTLENIERRLDFSCTEVRRPFINDGLASLLKE